MAAGKNLKPFTFYLSRQEKQLVKSLAAHGKTSSAKVLRRMIQMAANRSAASTSKVPPKLKEHAQAVLTQGG